jgi:hypothetical protein
MDSGVGHVDGPENSKAIKFFWAVSNGSGSKWTSGARIGQFHKEKSCCRTYLFQAIRVGRPTKLELMGPK